MCSVPEKLEVTPQKFVAEQDVIEILFKKSGLITFLDFSCAFKNHPFLVNFYINLVNIRLHNNCHIENKSLIIL